MEKITTFYLDEETNKALEDLKWSNRTSRSKMVRSVFKFFEKNPDELKKILESEKNEK